MTTVYDGFIGVACGNFRKKVLWKTTPYDQTAIAITTSKSGFLSRLIYALTCAFWKCAFWKRNPEAPVTGTNEEQRNLANIFAATEISNLKTITRYEIEHSKTFLHSRTTTSDVGEGDKANISSNSHFLRLKASTSGPLNKHAVKGIKQTSIPKAGKHRSSVLYDLRPGGVIRRIRQKADLYSQGSSLSKHKSEFVSIAQRLLLCSEPKQKASNAFHTTTSDVGEGDKANISNNSHALRLKASTSAPLNKRAVKGIKRISIPRAFEEDVEHLERRSLKGKHSSSRLAGKTEKSATKLTSNLALGSRDKVESSKLLLSSQSNQKSEGQHRIEENGPQQFGAPLIMQGNASTINAASTLALPPAEPPQKKPAFQMCVPEHFEGLDDDNHSTAPIQGNAPTTNATSTLALPAEPPQKKPAFQMSVPEDFEVLGDDNHSTAPVQGNAPIRNDASTLALTEMPPQKKRVFQDFEVSDDDNHSTRPIQGNAPTTDAPSTLAPTTEPPQKKHAFQYFEVLGDDNHSAAPVQGNVPTTNAAPSLALRSISYEYDDPPQKKLRRRFSYDQ